MQVKTGGFHVYENSGVRLSLRQIKFQDKDGTLKKCVGELLGKSIQLQCSPFDE